MSLRNSPEKDAFDIQAEELGAMLKESQQWLADVEATESTKSALSRPAFQIPVVNDGALQVPAASSLQQNPMARELAALQEKEELEEAIAQAQQEMQQLLQLQRDAIRQQGLAKQQSKPDSVARTQFSRRNQGKMSSEYLEDVREAARNAVLDAVNAAVAEVLQLSSAHLSAPVKEPSQQKATKQIRQSKAGVVMIPQVTKKGKRGSDDVEHVQVVREAAHTAVIEAVDAAVDLVFKCSERPLLTSDEESNMQRATANEIITSHNQNDIRRPGYSIASPRCNRSGSAGSVGARELMPPPEVEKELLPQRGKAKGRKAITNLKVVKKQTSFLDAGPDMRVLSEPPTHWGGGIGSWRQMQIPETRRRLGSPDYIAPEQIRSRSKERREANSLDLTTGKASRKDFSSMMVQISGNPIAADYKDFALAQDLNRMHQETIALQIENAQLRHSLGSKEYMRSYEETQNHINQMIELEERNACLIGDVDRLVMDNNMLRDMTKDLTGMLNQRSENENFSAPIDMSTEQETHRLRHENSKLRNSWEKAYQCQLTLESEIADLRAALSHSPPKSKRRNTNDTCTITLVLKTDFKKAGELGSREREAFETLLLQDLSHSTGIPASDFQIRGIRAGSIVAEVGILKSATCPSPMHVARDLEKQAYAPASRLCTGTVTRDIEVFMMSADEEDTHQGEDSMANKMTAMEDEIKRINTSLFSVSKSREDLQIEVESYKFKLSVCDEQLNQLQRANMECESKNKSLLAVSESHWKLEEEMRSLTESYKEELSALDAELQVSKGEIESTAKSLFSVSERCSHLEEEVRFYKLELSARERQLEESHKKELSALDAELQMSKGEIKSSAQSLFSVSERCSHLEEEVKSYKLELSARERQLEELQETHNQAERINKSTSNPSVEVESLRKALGSCHAELKEVSLAKQHEAQKNIDLENLLKESRKLLSDQQRQKTVDQARCKELVHLIKGCIDKDHFVEHESITNMNSGENKSTIGISYEDMNCTVTGLLVGGPAFNTKSIQTGDIIVAIDGTPSKGNESRLSELLRGNDQPGSLCMITIKHATSGVTEEIKIQREAMERIADKRKMFELITKIKDRFNKDVDEKGLKYTGEVLQLWSEMMQEEQKQDEECINNIHDMQVQCGAWLVELQHELDRQSAAGIERFVDAEEDRQVGEEAGTFPPKEAYDKMATKDTQLAAEIQQLRSDASGFEQEMIVFRETSETLARERKAARQLVLELIVELELFSSEIDEIKSESAYSEMQAGESRNSRIMSTLTGEIQNLQRALGGKSEELAFLREDTRKLLDKAGAELSHLQERYVTKDKENRQLKSSLEEAKMMQEQETTFDTDEELLQTKNEKLRQSQQQLEEALAGHQMLQDELGRHIKESDALQLELHLQKEELKNTRNLSIELSKHKVEKEQLQIALLRKQAAESEQTAKIVALQSTLSRMQTTEAELTGKLLELQNSLDRERLQREVNGGDNGIHEQVQKQELGQQKFHMELQRNLSLAKEETELLQKKAQLLSDAADDSAVRAQVEDALRRQAASDKQQIVALEQELFIFRKRESDARALVEQMNAQSGSDSDPLGASSRPFERPRFNSANLAALEQELLSDVINGRATSLHHEEYDVPLNGSEILSDRRNVEVSHSQREPLLGSPSSLQDPLPMLPQDPLELLTSTEDDIHDFLEI